MRTAVVTGAGGELTRAIVERLVADAWRVVAVGRRRVELAGVVPCAADVTDDSCREAIRAAVGDDPVGLLVHAAAAPGGGGIETVAAAAVLAAVNVKVNGLLRVVRAVDDRWAAGGRVVALGGSLGYDPSPDAATAGIANAALANAVRQVAAWLGPRGISCHVVAPGPVDTGRYRDLAAAEAARRGVAAGAVLEEARAASPLGRLTEPDEVAWAVCRLTDPEAAALNGGTLLLDTGRRTAIP